MRSTDLLRVGQRWIWWIMLLAAAPGMAQVNDKSEIKDLPDASDEIADSTREENLSLFRYRPVYFIYGIPDTKIQISFKFLLIRTIPLYAGYSELIFWRLRENSKPFEDANYNPELFYRWSFGKNQSSSIDLGPWSHHSNGKAGGVSRSMDESYVRVNTRMEFGELTLLLSATGATRYNQDATNSDLYLYRGPFEFQVSTINLLRVNPIVDNSDLTFRFFPGGKRGERWRTGGYELGYNFRLGPVDVLPTLYIQYYQGFAESLINYNKMVRQFRAGISF